MVTYEKLYDIVLGDKEFWKKLHDAYSEGKIVIDTQSSSDKYVEAIKNYMNEL